MLRDFKTFKVREDAILTNSYVAGSILGTTDEDLGRPSEFNQLVVYVDFTIGSLTDGQVKVEFSPDGTNWYQETSSSISSGVSTDSELVHKFTATGVYRLAIPINDTYIRISAIGTGTVTSSSMGIKAVLGNS